MKTLLTVSILVTTISAAQSGLPSMLENVGIDQRLNERIPLDLQFQDEAGAAVRIRDYFRGKPVVLSLVYYECPMLCTEVLNGALRSFRAIPLDIGRDFEVLTVSIDPGETPELAARKKSQYLERYRRNGASHGWHFLTGGEREIKQLADAVGFRYTYDPKTRQFAHAAGVMVLTSAGVLSRYLYGVEYPAKDLRLSLVEASANKIGSPVDRILLFCFHYDPQTGKYSVAIMNVLRLGALATVASLGTFIFAMLRRNPRLKYEV
jgi:protein SCO1/2